MKPTIVTAYYRFPSKHTYEEYDKWIADFAATFDTPVVFFGEEYWCRKFKLLRGLRPTECIVLPFNELSSHSITDWFEVFHKDKFKHLHSPDLYVIWNEKSRFAERAIKLNPFASEHFAWMDIGCNRNGVVPSMLNWPNIEKLESRKIAVAEAEPFQLSDSFLDPKSGLPVDFHGTNRLSGAMMVGDIAAWLWWILAFYDTVQRFVHAGRHCGLDQNAMSATAILYPALVQIVKPPENVNKWFYLHQYFASCR